MVIFSLIFVCLGNKRNALGIYLQFPLRTSEAVIFIPYMLLPLTQEVMLLICSRVTRLPAGWKLEMIKQVTRNPFYLILLFELESTNYRNHLDAEYI